MRKCICIAGLLVLAGLASGCKTTFRTVDEHFMAQPANYRHVQILPVWFEGAGNIDHSLTTNDLQALCRQAGEDLVSAVQQELRSKGYEVIGPVRVLRADEIFSQPAAEIRRPLEAVRVDFCKNLVGRYSASANGAPLTFRTNTTLSLFRYMATPHPAEIEHNPFHYQMTSSLTNVLVRFGATNSEAVLLMDTKAFFESRHQQTKRLWWNWTGGGVIATTEVGVNLAVVAVAALAGAGTAPVPIWIDPFWHSDNSIQHSIALVDIRTQEVLWLNRQDFKHKKARDPEILTGTVAGTLADLPPIDQQ
jgi:hypothetical protein